MIKNIYHPLHDGRYFRYLEGTYISVNYVLIIVVTCSNLLLLPYYQDFGCTSYEHDLLCLYIHEGKATHPAEMGLILSSY